MKDVVAGRLPNIFKDRHFRKTSFKGSSCFPIFLHSLGHQESCPNMQVRSWLDPNLRLSPVPDSFLHQSHSCMMCKFPSHLHPVRTESLPPTTYTWWLSCTEMFRELVMVFSISKFSALPSSCNILPILHLLENSLFWNSNPAIVPFRKRSLD